MSGERPVEFEAERLARIEEEVVGRARALRAAAADLARAARRTNGEIEAARAGIAAERERREEGERSIGALAAEEEGRRGREERRTAAEIAPVVEALEAGIAATVAAGEGLSRAVERGEKIDLDVVRSREILRAHLELLERLSDVGFAAADRAAPIREGARMLLDELSTVLGEAGAVEAGRDGT